MFASKTLALITSLWFVRIVAASQTEQQHVNNNKNKKEDMDSTHVRRRLHHWLGNYNERTVEDVVVQSGALETLESLLVLEGVGLAPEGPLDDAEGGEFTLFAPIDHAFEETFEEYPGLQDFLLANPDVLQTVLLYHVLAAQVLYQDIPDGTTTLTNTLLGEEEPLVVERTCWWFGWFCAIYLTDGTNERARVILPNYRANNGVVHAIDKVLIPPSLAETVVQGNFGGDN